MTDSETEQNEKKASGGLKRWIGYGLKYLVPLLVTVLLCKLLFDGVDFSEMMSIIRDQCDFRWIGLALVISIFSHVFRAMRWR
ncbi:MAG: flippase-like domain-containing protein, partial [Muribaculaceae bacterium]|nr:flippase-like domain-containing protein [Muribaculaceae bacterium]